MRPLSPRHGKLIMYAACFTAAEENPAIGHCFLKALFEIILSQGPAVANSSVRLFLCNPGQTDHRGPYAKQSSIEEISFLYRGKFTTAVGQFISLKSCSYWFSEDREPRDIFKAFAYVVSSFFRVCCSFILFPWRHNIDGTNFPLVSALCLIAELIKGH